MYLIISAFLCIFVNLSVCSYLEILINGKYPKFYYNSSFGLEHVNELGHHCPNYSVNGKYYMKYTPNRKLQNLTLYDSLQLGFVVALGGHSNGIYDYGKFGALNGLMSVWDSWMDNYFSLASNSSSLIVLFDERDYHRLNFSSSKSEYLDSIAINNMGAKPVDCVRLRHTTNGHEANTAYSSARIDNDKLSKYIQKGCSNDLHLDQNYKVYFIDVKSSDNNTDNLNDQPVFLFAAVHKFPPPEWASGINMTEEDKLYSDWRPGRLRRAFQTNYGYVKLTNWYSYHMMKLSILDFFDYVGKLDSDVKFTSPFPTLDLPHRLAANQAKVLVTHDGWYNDAPQVCQGLGLCLNAFIDNENKYCRKTNPLSTNIEITPAGYESHSIFWDKKMLTTFRSHFTILWLGIYQSPESMKLAKFWNDFHPHGMWDYRWGDQQWWPRPLAMFSHDGSTDSDFDHFLVLDCENGTFMSHKPWPLFGTLKSTDYFHPDGLSQAIRTERYNNAAKKFIY